MFRIFWTDIDQNGENVSGHRDFWDPKKFRLWFDDKSGSVQIYRMQNMTPTREELVREKLIGAA